MEVEYTISLPALVTFTGYSPVAMEITLSKPNLEISLQGFHWLWTLWNGERLRDLLVGVNLLYKNIIASVCGDFANEPQVVL